MVDDQASWARETHGTIKDKSNITITESIKNVEKYLSSSIDAQGSSTETIGGVKLIEVLGALKLLSAGTANLSAADNLNLTTASDMNTAVANNAKTSIGNDEIHKVKNNWTTTISANDSRTVTETDTQDIGTTQTIIIGNERSTTVGTNDTTIVTGNRSQTIGGNSVKTVIGTDSEAVTGGKSIVASMIALQAATFTMGNGSGTDVLSLVSDLMVVVKELAQTVAGHTHGNNGAAAPSTSGAHSAQASRASGLNNDLSGLIG